MSFQLLPKSVTLNGVMAVILRYLANSGSFRAHCIKVHVRYLISWWVLVSLCQLTSLTIHNSLSLSLPASGPRTDSTDFITDRLFWASRFLFSFFITLWISFFVWFGSVWKVKLAIRQLLDAHKYSASYHIVS